MTILVTGAKGFVGKNLCPALRNGQHHLLEFDLDTEPAELDVSARTCGFVFHLAGVNRPQHNEDFMQGNFGFTSKLLNMLKKHRNNCPVVFTSSIQASDPNPYGLSKKACEDLLFSYGTETGAKVLIYRLPNVFGKWCRPDYNSAVATFCHNSSRGLPVHVDDPEKTVTLAYIDDVVAEFLEALNGHECRRESFCYVPTVYTKTLGEISALIEGFGTGRSAGTIPNQADAFERALYSTYLSCLPADGLSYPLKMNTDPRGSFTEILRTPDRGQISVIVTKPGITRGNHWHFSKNEKFLVVRGKGKIELQRYGGSEIMTYDVSGEKMEAVEIPPGYIHTLQNTGDIDLVTLTWVNEPYDPGNPDTYVQSIGG